VITDKEATIRGVKYDQAGCSYLFDLINYDEKGEQKSNYVIDAKYKFNVTRFFNHSCSPNCEGLYAFVGGSCHIGIFTTKDIKKNTEITIDYQYQRLDLENPLKCECGESNCIGFLTKFQPTCLICKKEVKNEFVTCEGCGKLGHLSCNNQKSKFVCYICKSQNFVSLNKSLN
jgi:hypothetical protein